MKLGDATREYVANKQATGMVFEAEAYILRALTEKLGPNVPIRKITSDSVLGYLNGHGPVTLFWHRKHDALSGFWTFAIQHGYTDRSPVPARRPKKPIPFIPYIYTREELRRLLHGVTSYQERWCKLEPITLRALLLLLYGAGGGETLNGIVNRYSQELSYVNDVGMSGLGTGIGLSLNVHSDNSGPYTNISYSGPGICAQIYDGGGGTIHQTRGIHGLKCNMTNNSGAAIYVDAPNNSLEDVDVVGGGTLQDGILVGSRAPAYNNVLFNLSGNTLKNVLHISAAKTSGVPNVSDVTALGVTWTGNVTHTVQDDLTSPATGLTDATVGMYVIGEPVTGNTSGIGYSRFTTSPSTTSTGAVTWLVGTGAPPKVGACAAGSLYSCTSSAANCTFGGSSYTLYGCIGGSNGWEGIK